MEQKTISRISGLPLKIMLLSEAQKDPHLTDFLKVHSFSEFSINGDSFCFKDFLYNGTHYVVCTEDDINETSISCLKDFYSVDFLKTFKIVDTSLWDKIDEKIFYHQKDADTLWKYIPELIR